MMKKINEMIMNMKLRIVTKKINETGIRIY